MNRRDFLKVTSLGAAGALLTGLPGCQGLTPAYGLQPLSWPAAVEAVCKVFQQVPSDRIAFLAGSFPDHIFDLFQLIAAGLGSSQALRYSLPAEMDGRQALLDAAQRLFGLAALPTFDAARVDTVFTFGATFYEPWLAGLAGKQPHGQLQTVEISPRKRLPQSEWFPVLPGGEGWAALAAGKLAAYLLGLDFPEIYAGVDIDRAAATAGLTRDSLLTLANRFTQSNSRLALPGALALGQLQGRLAAEAILSLNVCGGNLGQPGGLWLLTEGPVQPALRHQANVFAELAALVERMRQGLVGCLFVHGLQAGRDLPASLGFEAALAGVPQVFTFAPTQEEFQSAAMTVLPDTPERFWGYQRQVGGDRPEVLRLQPPDVSGPRCSAADLLLEAARQSGGRLQSALPFPDADAFVRASLPADTGAGGWRPAQPVRLAPPNPASLSMRLEPLQTLPRDLTLLPVMAPGAPAGTRALLAELHPQLASELGVATGQRALLRSEQGETPVEIKVTAQIVPQAVCVPCAPGQAAALQRMLAPLQNEAGGLAFAANRVWLKTGNSVRQGK